MAYTTIDDPSKHFQTKIYTGNGSSNHAITFDGNSNLQPDLIWNKSRSIADSHAMFDSSRGVNKILFPNVANVESTDTNGNLESFDSNGITVGGNQEYANKSSSSQVTWAWKANGGTRTTNTESGSNPGGGYQANTTAGFSIVDYTGTGSAGTMAHGLGVAPNFVLVKGRSTGEHWTATLMNVTNSPVDETDRIKFNEAETAQDNSVYWNDTAASSTNVTLGSGDATNKDGDTYIMYVFASIQGFSKVGFYTGSGNANGPFIYTGFKPAWVMVKQTTTTNRDWRIVDNARDTYNLSTTELKPNTTGAETTSGMQLDLLANGFKIRTTSTACNSSSDTYIYMAFAEHPFVSSEGVPCTAR